MQDPQPVMVCWKEAWKPLAQPEGLQPDEEVWHIESTGEVFRSYETFLQRKDVYGQSVWSCKYTGKGGLTFEEAQAAEAKAVKQLESFPKDQEERVCRSVHHSLARIEELVASIYDALRPAAHAEPQQQAEQGEQQSSPFGSKENEPQQGGAAAAGEKPAGSGGEAPAAEAPAAAGDAAEEGAAAAAEPATAKKTEAEGESAAEGKAGGEAKTSRKPKTPRAPISKQLLRIFIVENAEQQGPEHATNQVWVVRPALRQRYDLPDEVPKDVQAALAASVKAPKRKLEAPKGLGTKLPTKKGKKEAAAGGEGAAEGGDGGATPAVAKKEKEAVPMQRVEAKTWEEVERQYKEGTMKHTVAMVLKAVQPEALNVQGIVDKAKELGIKEAFEDKEKARMANVLTTDPNFLRLSKGAYSLHCFHPDKEQLVRVQPPKEPKSGKKAAAAGAAAGGAMPAAGGGEAAGESGATPAAAAGKKEKEAVPMQRVEAKTWEEVERQYKEGTLKAHLVAVLKAVQPEALTVQGIIDKAKELGIEGLEEKGKAASQALATDPNFLRLSKGAYSLHCFHPDKEQLVRVQPPKEKKEKAPAEGATPAAAGEGEGGRQPEKDNVPMIAVEAKSWEEVEKQYREGTLKAHVVAVLKAVQPEALTTQGIIDKAKELGLHDFEEKQKAAIGQALATDPNFLRLSKGAYSLHCFHPDKPNLIRDPAHKKRKMTDFLEEEEGGSKRHEGTAAAGGDQEADSITRAEQLVRHTKRALARHREALEKAQAEYDAAKAKWEEEKKLGKATPSKEAAKERRQSEIAIPPEQLAQFELSEEERTFKGEADDRKGMLEHRQKLQARVKELEKAKKAFLEAERKKRETAAREAGKEAKAVEVAFRKAERALEHERRAVETAEKAAAAADKKLEKEKEKAVRGEERAKEREEREKQKAVEREERERRRAEKAKEKEEAKRYPLEDLELMEELRQKAADAGEPAPAEDVAQPSWLTPEDSQRLSTALYVSDLATQFAKQLGVKALHYDGFEKVLADATGKGEQGPAAGDDLSAGTLHNLYERLIEVILEDLCSEDLATPQEKRWALLLGAGTWPEVLRRLVLTRAQDEDNPDQRPDQPAVMAASMLAYDSADKLTHDQHLALLRFLCDAVLDTEKMRGILQRRQDEAEDAMRDVRGEVAEQRKQLKELLDAEKEERRRKREERRKEEEEKAAAAAAAGEGAASGEGGAAEGGEGTAGDKASGSAEAMDVDGQEEAEPSFELPARLREYPGPADDRKALVQWRQEQQAERRRLEKERNRWMAEQLRRQRELEAKEKAARAEQELREKEKREMFDAIEQAQEELEEKLEKYATRRLPLGYDRHQRRYWWGLAAHRPVVWVEDAEGRWGAYSTASELEVLIASLERRGVRELALAEAIEKKYHAITGAMARAERSAAAAEKAGAKGVEKEKERAEPPRRSGRTAQQPEFFDPANKISKDATSTSLASLFGPAEAVAAEAAADTMQELQKSAAGAHVEAPAGYDSWKDWGSAVKAAAAGELEESREAPTAAALRSLLQGKLQQLEEALLASSVGGLAADGDESEGEGSGEAGEGQGSEGGSPAGDGGGISRTQSAQVLAPEEVVDDLFSPTKRQEARYLWKTQRERSVWLTDLRQAATAARIAYCAAVLEQQAEPMLAALAKAGAKASGGKKGGKAAAGKAAGAGGSKAAAAAGSRPVSRANSTANLEAAAEAKGSGKGSSKGSGKAAAASGKRRAPPLPDNMRQTRSRH